MNLRDFRIGWRLLVKEPAYSAVVILGLTIGFAVCFLLLGLVQHSFSYNRHIAGAEDIYTIKQRWNVPGSDGNWFDSASLPARDAVLAGGLPLSATAVITRKIDVRVGAAVQPMDIAVVDPAFRTIFNPPVLAGDLAAALSRPDAIALTRASALKLFGQLDVVGKTVASGGQPYVIAALLEDPPSATSIPFESLAGTGTRLWDEEYRKMVTTNWGSSHGPVYLKLARGVTQDAVVQQLRRVFVASPFYTAQSAQQLAALGGKDMIDFKLGALPDAYLDPDIRQRSRTHGDRQTVLGLAAVGLLILLLAATNYVNLATVRTLRRQREIAVRKVLGASAQAVSRQFLAESVLVCLIATALGLLLAWLMLPVFSDLVQRTLDRMFTPASLLASAALGVLLGVAAGAYPTWSALRVRPTAALSGRGNAETVGGLWMRRVLTVLQFATAMGLTGITLAVAWQTSYASKLNPGFDPQPLLLVPTTADMRDASFSALRDAIRRVPGVAGVTASDAPVTVNENSTAMQRDGGEPIEIPYSLVSPDFFQVYGLKPVAGRLYSPDRDTMLDTDKIIVNAAGAARFGFASPQDAIGKFIRNPEGDGKPRQVIGIAPDIRHRSARDPVQPTIYLLSRRTDTLSVKVSGDAQAVQKSIEELWPRFFPNGVLEVKRMEGMFADNYADDLRLAKLLAASSVIAIAIAAFGIYVLSAYSVQRRSREIVLRKLYGASSAAIGRLVIREFAALIGAGALLGLPIAWLATERYLAAFTERAPIGLWTMGAALAVASAVALGSTLRHTLAAVRVAPALALRD